MNWGTESKDAEPTDDKPGRNKADHISGKSTEKHDSAPGNSPQINVSGAARDTPGRTAKFLIGLRGDLEISEDSATKDGTEETSADWNDRISIRTVYVHINDPAPQTNTPASEDERPATYDSNGDEQRTNISTHKLQKLRVLIYSVSPRPCICRQKFTRLGSTFSLRFLI